MVTNRQRGISSDGRYGSDLLTDHFENAACSSACRSATEVQQYRSGFSRNLDSGRRVSFEDGWNSGIPDVSAEARVDTRSSVHRPRRAADVGSPERRSLVFRSTDTGGDGSSRCSGRSSRSSRHSDGTDQRTSSSRRRSSSKSERRRSSRRSDTSSPPRDDDGGSSRSRGRSVNRSSRRGSPVRSQSPDDDDTPIRNRRRPRERRDVDGGDGGDDPGSSDDSDDTSSSDDNGDRRPSPRRHGNGSPDGSGRRPTEVRQARVRQLPVKPEHFDGSGCFQTFMCLFENSADFNGWNDRAKAAHFRAALRGEAAQLLWGAEKFTYKEIVQKLKKRYGGEGTQRKYKIELKYRRRKDGETIPQLAQDITRLLSLAYPDEESKLLEDIACDAFLSALDNIDLEVRIRDQNPPDLDSVVKLAQRYELSRGVADMSRDARPLRDRALRQVAQEDAVSAPGDRGYEAVESRPDRRPRGNRQHSRKFSRAVGAATSNEAARPTSSGPPPVTDTRPAQNWQSQIQKMAEEIARLKQEREQPVQPTYAREDSYSYRNNNDTYWYPSRSYGSYSQNCGMQPSGAPPEFYNSASQQKQCWTCGSFRHFARACPYGKNLPQQNQQQAPSQLTPARNNNVVGSCSASGSDHATYLKARINGVDCECLLDMGSEVTILPYDMVKDCRIRATTQTLKAANGSLIPVVGEATVSFSTPKYRAWITGLVTEHVAEPMLGINWICQNCERWNFRDAAVTLNGRDHKLIVRHGVSKRCRRVVIEHDTEIPPRSQVDLACKIVFGGRPPGSTTSNLMEPCWGTRPAVISAGTYIARTITPEDKFAHVPVRALNVQHHACSVKAGTPVSDLEALDIISPIQNMALSESPDSGPTSVATSAVLDQVVPAYVSQLVEAVEPSTPESAVLWLKRLILAHRHVFSESETDLGRTDVMKHRIDTGNARPIRQQLRRYPPAHVEAISDHIDTMLAQDVIEPAASPWTSNIVLVRKKDGTYRCCIDYRRLNDVTIKDAYPLPRVDESLEAMSSASWFTTMDTRASYHQIKVLEADRDKTTFICPRGMFRFRTMQVCIRTTVTKNDVQNVHRQPAHKLTNDDVTDESLL